MPSPSGRRLLTPVKSIRNILPPSPPLRYHRGPFNTKVAAGVRGFEPTCYVNRKEAHRTDRFTRLAVAASIRAGDIDWGNRTMRVIGKGNKEGLAPFGAMSQAYLKEWLAEYSPNVDCRKEVQETSWWGSGGIPQRQYSPKIGG
ncbi:MAG: hypothetical protein NTU41_01650 [Chloroflexi bacterium]|nr:hypothetical protein [Chloroflexota bacterium]